MSLEHRSLLKLINIISSKTIYSVIVINSSYNKGSLTQNFNQLSELKQK